MSRARDKHAIVTNSATKRRHVLCFRVFAIILFSVIQLNVLVVNAQEPAQWSPQQRIPGYNDETWPPFLVADQNRTVHAFAYQQVGEDGKEIAIIYNQWTLEQGWTSPVDILLSPIKHEARIMGAFLDKTGVLHVVFYGGDETEANIYYVQAPAVSAGRASAWSTPRPVGEDADNPSLAALAGDDKGNLIIVYSGKQAGRGLYTLYSTDGGDTWTDPTPTFLTYSDELFPFSLKLSPGQPGLIHAVWDVRDLGGNGRQINYAKLNIANRNWSEPVTLAEAETGYGVLVPTVIEHDGSVFALYIMVPKVVMRRSSDGGQTWTDPVLPFVRHVGANGTMSLVADSNDDLHLFWGQRIPNEGGPATHGMWHSMWQGGDRWPEPEAVVSGPPVNDLKGDKSFDPYNAQAVVSQGNVLLVTWRTDPGPQSKPNGVWYSYARLDAPELPVVPLPTVSYTPTPVPTATATPLGPTPTPTRKPALLDQGDQGPAQNSFQDTNPAWPVIAGIAPIMLLIVTIFFIRYSSILHNRR